MTTYTPLSLDEELDDLLDELQDDWNIWNHDQKLAVEELITCARIAVQNDFCDEVPSRVMARLLLELCAYRRKDQ